MFYSTAVAAHVVMYPDQFSSTCPAHLLYLLTVMSCRRLCVVPVLLGPLALLAIVQPVSSLHVAPGLRGSGNDLLARVEASSIKFNKAIRLSLRCSLTVGSISPSTGFASFQFLSKSSVFSTVPESLAIMLPVTSRFCSTVVAAHVVGQIVSACNCRITQ